MSYTQLTKLDFAAIKASLKDYLRNNSDFAGYDFDGSTLSVLLDLLAYNTYYTAFNTNMAVNESFLDSATIRDNVVSLAKHLGYTPKSTQSARTIASIRATWPTGITAPPQVVWKAGTGLISTIDNVTYTFVSPTDVQVTPVGNTATFSNLVLLEGVLVKEEFTVVPSDTTQRFILNNPSIDVSTIQVYVRPNATSTAKTLYNAASSIMNLDANSLIYFVQEVEDERYELIFGDDVIGRKLAHNEVVEVRYLVSEGSAANSATAYNFNATLTDLNNNVTTPQITILSATKSDSGEDIETIKSIKLNAPRNYSSQNRAVTADDYKTIVRNIYPSIADIICYGGEDDDPPQYGKVLITIKPKYSTTLSSFTKNEIKTKLKKYSVLSVTPEIIDPAIIYVELYSEIFYNPISTTLNDNEIYNAVYEALVDYKTNTDVEKFEGRLKYSKLMSLIDNSEPSILSNLTNLKMRKDFYPVVNTKTSYELCYQNAFNPSCESGETVISTTFRVAEFPDETVYFGDNAGVIQLYTNTSSGIREVKRANIGTVNYATGEIMIDNLIILKSEREDGLVQVRTIPKNNDINSFRNAFLTLDLSNSVFNIIQQSA